MEHVKSTLFVVCLNDFIIVTIQHLKSGNASIPRLWAARDAKASCPPEIIHKIPSSEQAPCLIFYELSQVLNSYKQIT